MSTRPWLKFYPSDWLGSSRLRRCSLEARGLAIELICHMHQGEPYGHLNVKGNAAIAKLVGIHHHTVGNLLGDLVGHGVCKLSDTTGVVYSPRMVRDHEKALKRQADGAMGGNPALQKVVIHEDKPSDTRYQRPERKRESTASPNPSAKIEGKKGSGNSRKKPSVGFPSEFKLSEASKAHGERLGFSPTEIDRAFARFRGHHIAKGSVFADWDQAFRNWVDIDAERFGRKPRAATSPANGGAVEFLMMPGSPQFLAWKAHYSDLGKSGAGMIRQLNQRELEGRPWPFDSEWPPAHQHRARSAHAGHLAPGASR